MDHKIKYIQIEGGTELISKVDIEGWEKTNHINLYDPFRIYPIPPFLQGPLGIETTNQTLMLMKWIPWTDDVSIKFSINKILVVTDVSINMQEYYKTSIQKHTDASFENELNIGDKNALPILEELGKIENLEQEIIDAAPENIEELADILHELTKKTKKRILH
jgi:hypothetical protein